MGRKDLVDIFRGHNFRLFRLRVENGVRQRFAFVEEGEILLGILADGHDRLAHRIRGALGLDLVDELFELEGQVFRKGASFLPGQNTSQIIFCGEWTMGID